MEYFTREEVAVILKVSMRTVDRRILSGELQCDRLGKGTRAPVRISEEQLTKFREANRSTEWVNLKSKAASILN